MELSTGSDLLRYNMKDKTFVVIDSETSGLNLFYTLPFNIGIQVYRNNTLIENHNIYIKWPDYKIRPDLALKVHYNKEHIDVYGKEPKLVLDFLLKYLNNKEYYYVGNNIIGYDAMIFHNYAKKLGVNLSYDFLNRLYDNNCIFKGYKLNRKPNYDNFLAWQYSLSNFLQKGLKSSVGTACSEFDIPYNKDDAHSAQYDCEKSWLIFKELVKKVELK